LKDTDNLLAVVISGAVVTTMLLLKSLLNRWDEAQAKKAAESNMKALGYRSSESKDMAE
jgi:hypothetical protein